MRQNFSPHKHSFEDAPHKHSFLFIAHKRVVVYLYFEVKTTPYSGVISKKTRKKKGHRQHRGHAKHTGRDDAVDLFFWRSHLKWQKPEKFVTAMTSPKIKKKKVIAYFAAPFPSLLA